MIRTTARPATLIGAIGALALGTSQAAAFFAAREVPAAPPASYAAQWYTTASGCSYSRASAPGYGVTWVLIHNPHHIGQPNARPHCPALLQPRR